MNDIREQPTDLTLGLVSGLAAGAVGAWAMTGFQALLSRAGITSGVSGAPSTEKAADSLSNLATGRSLPRSARPAAGEAVHYAVGGLVGGVYGMAAEAAPRVTAGGGVAFGVAAATVVDETLVPAFGFGDPLWRAPAFSHLYSYLSHLVFGTVTEGSRRLFRRFFGDVRAGAAGMQKQEPRRPIETVGPSGRRTLALAFLLGATAGPRTTAPLTIVAWAARMGWIDLAGSRLAFLASPKALTVITPMAIGELVADKLPSTPDRTMPMGVAARAVSGAISGAALVGNRSMSAACAGAAGAIAATYVGHAIRGRVSRAVGTDWPVAAAEDVLAFGGAALVCLAALAPSARR